MRWCTGAQDHAIHISVATIGAGTSSFQKEHWVTTGPQPCGRCTPTRTSSSSTTPCPPSTPAWAGPCSTSASWVWARPAITPGGEGQPLALVFVCVAGLRQFKSGFETGKSGMVPHLSQNPSILMSVVGNSASSCASCTRAWRLFFPHHSFVM